MFAAIASWFLGGGARGLAAQLRGAYADRLAAENDTQRIEADKKIALLTARVDAQTRGAGTWWAKFVRACFAAPFVIYNGKLIIWDKVLGWGTTDPLSPYLEGVGWTVIGFYFLDNTIRYLRS